jgi:hypothetical protein
VLKTKLRIEDKISMKEENNKDNKVKNMTIQMMNNNHKETNLLCTYLARAIQWKIVKANNG